MRGTRARQGAARPISGSGGRRRQAAAVVLSERLFASCPSQLDALFTTATPVPQGAPAVAVQAGAAAPALLLAVRGAKTTTGIVGLPLVRAMHPTQLTADRYSQGRLSSAAFGALQP